MITEADRRRIRRLSDVALGLLACFLLPLAIVGTVTAFSLEVFDEIERRGSAK